MRPWPLVAAPGMNIGLVAIAAKPDLLVSGDGPGVEVANAIEAKNALSGMALPVERLKAAPSVWPLLVVFEKAGDWI